MFGIGTEELMLILVIALVVLGPERMPKLARDLGRMVGDFRRTSDELRAEFLNADTIIDVAAKSASTPAIAPPGTPAVAGPSEATPATPVDGALPLSAEALLQPEEALPAETPPAETPPADGVDVTTLPGDPPPAVAGADATASTAPAEPDETLFDREAREAYERLQDPARARQAAAEGWKTPSDDAGTTDRWG